MFRSLFLLVLMLFVHLTCAAQGNRDMLFNETWYTAEGLVMTFDSSGVTWEGSKHKYFIDEHAIRHTNRTELVDGQSRNVVYANYQVHTDSLILEFVYDVGLWMFPPVPMVFSDVENEKPKLVLYNTAHFYKKEPLDNFLSFSVNMSWSMSVESNGAITFKSGAQIEFADRVVYGVYRGLLDSPQLYALRTALRDSGFFQISREDRWRECRSSNYTCNTSNYASPDVYVYNPAVKCFGSTQAKKIYAIVNEILLSSDAWERNGMKYYGLKGELEEPMEEIFLDWKPGMPEKLRIAVSGPIRFIEKVSTLDSTAYVYAVKVDTVYGDPSYGPVYQTRPRKRYPDIKHLINNELIVVSTLPVSAVSNYCGLVLTKKSVQTLTWQSDHTGRPYAYASYFEIQETFSVDGLAVRFSRSEWDYIDDRNRRDWYFLNYEKWPPSNLVSSNFEFKVAKAVRQAQGQDNYIRRDRNGRILPLVE